MIEVVGDALVHLHEGEPESLAGLELGTTAVHSIEMRGGRPRAPHRGRDPETDPREHARLRVALRGEEVSFPRRASAPTSVGLSVRSTTCMSVVRRKSASRSRSATQRATWSRVSICIGRKRTRLLFVSNAEEVLPHSGALRGRRRIASVPGSGGQPVLTFGVTVLPDPPHTRFLELMQLAEANRFDHGWTYDSHILWHDAYPLLTLLAMQRRSSSSATASRTRARASRRSPRAPTRRCTPSRAAARSWGSAAATPPGG